MIKAVLKDDSGNRLVIFGLEPRNIELLQLGKPILIKMEDLGMPETGHVVIMFGETKEQIADAIGASHLMEQAQ